MVRHLIYARLMALSLGWTSPWGSLPGALALIQAVLLGAESAPKSVDYEKSLLTRTNTARKSDGWFPGFTDQLRSFPGERPAGRCPISICCARRYL